MRTIGSPVRASTSVRGLSLSHQPAVLGPQPHTQQRQRRPSFSKAQRSSGHRTSVSTGEAYVVASQGLVEFVSGSNRADTQWL